MPPSIRRWTTRVALLIAALGAAAPAVADAAESPSLVVDGRSLASLLSDLKPLAATHLATSWALAPDAPRRAAVAQALEWQFPLFGDAAILEHLSYDVDPAIRAATARAAWTRRTAGSDGGVLPRLAQDPDAEVRAIATKAVGS